MRLVQHDRIGIRQELDKPAFTKREIGEQQVVIDDDEIGGLRTPASPGHVAFLEHRALLAEAVVRRGRDPGPYRGVLADRDDLGAIPGLGGVAPANERISLGATQCTVFRKRLVEPLQAEVVGSTLEYGGVDAAADRFAHRRQITMEQLVLQCARPGGHDGPRAGQHRRDQVSERLARARAGLDDQLLAVRDRVLDRPRHQLLRGSRREPRNHVGQPAIARKQLVGL